MVLNCIIADDDKTSQAVLKAFVEKHDRLNLMGVAGNGKQALTLANEYDLDLVFLDISMPVMNGFEFLDHLERHTELKVILVTSEREYALKAFEYNISDYLLKPISKHRFRQAIDWIIQSAGADHVYKRISKNDLMIRELIQVMISKDIDTLIPEPSAEGLTGYIYPFLIDNLNIEDWFDMLQILEIAENEGILTGSSVDMVHLCAKCSNNIFSITGTCPDCGSLNLKKSTADNEIKSTSTFSCGYCSAQFLRPLLKVKCQNCQKLQDIESLNPKVLKEYSLTTEGKKLAEGNLYFKSNHL